MLLANTSHQQVAGQRDARDRGFAPPSIELPKGGGALRATGEKFSANPVTGTGSVSIPIPLSPGRSGFGATLALSYDSASGNGPFGLGWTLALPRITRKTDRGLPRYLAGEESDVFILSDAEDLVPVEHPPGTLFEERDGHRIYRYRPRIEGMFARIERWTDMVSGETHWRTISPDNVTTLYGRTSESRIADPADPARVFQWLACESYDDRGNAIVWDYVRERLRRGRPRAGERAQSQRHQSWREPLPEAHPLRQSRLAPHRARSCRRRMAVRGGPRL